MAEILYKNLQPYYTYHITNYGYEENNSSSNSMNSMGIQNRILMGIQNRILDIIDPMKFPR